MKILRHFSGYYREGFLTVQRAIDLSLISHIQQQTTKTTITAADDIPLQLRRYPFPPYIYDPYVYVLQNDLPAVLLLSFLVLAPNICKDLVLEKERKLRVSDTFYFCMSKDFCTWLQPSFVDLQETMRMMGLKVWLSWLAWFVKYLIMMLAIVSILVLLFHVPIGEGAVIKYTLASVTFMFFFLYALTVITFCFMVSTFFSKDLF